VYGTPAGGGKKRKRMLRKKERVTNKGIRHFEANQVMDQGGAERGKGGKPIYPRTNTK